MTPDQYQLAAWRFARASVREGAAAIEHAELGLLSELGEVAGLFQKALRDDVPVDRDRLCLELGDVLWYAAACAMLRGRGLAVIQPEPDISRLPPRSLLFYAARSQSCLVPAVVAEIGRPHGITIEEVMRRNLEKLGERAATCTIGGSGEDRAAAVAAERAAVVAWLRAQVSQAAGPGDIDLDWAADAIEQGLHRESAP